MEFIFGKPRNDKGIPLKQRQFEQTEEGVRRHYRPVGDQIPSIG